MDALKMIPSKHSKKWTWVFGGSFIVIFAIVLICQLIITSRFTLNLLLGAAAISLLCSLVLCFGGFLGGRLFFLISALGTALGLLYMLYISIFNVAAGWGDLVSIIGFGVFFSYSAALGIIAETIYYIYLRKIKKRA